LACQQVVCEALNHVILRRCDAVCFRL